jgi:Spherulation-specific family 4
MVDLQRGVRFPGFPVLIACMLVLFALAPSVCGDQDAAAPKLAIPSYADPTSAGWNQWQSLGSDIVGIMVLNRNNGDDVSVDPAWVVAVRKTQGLGILVLGYVHTGYGHRDPKEIRSKIDGVYSKYKVDGIFLDETPTDCSAAASGGITTLAYYPALAGYISSKVGNHLVVLNPGTMPSENCWMSVADILVTFENPTLAAYQNSYTAAACTHVYPPSRFWNLVYSVPTAAAMQQVVRLAQQRGVGWLYVTDDGPDGNPWDSPATYLVDEAKASTGKGPVLPPAPHRVSIQWGGMKAPRTQVFLDTGQKGRRFIGAGTDLPADLMFEMPADGSVELKRYEGSGEDWTWTTVEAHPALSHPQPGTTRIEFDADPLGSATSIRIRFRLLDKDWNPTTASKVFTWRPN